MNDVEGIALRSYTPYYELCIGFDYRQIGAGLWTKDVLLERMCRVEQRDIYTYN
jgi:hypothetical protein